MGLEGGLCIWGALSGRRATRRYCIMAGITLISIHALREEGDGKSWFVLPAVDISIHALREEGDSEIGTPASSMDRFLSTPSARRATGPSVSATALLAYFYPRPPRGGRPLGLAYTPYFRYFYPRPPRGGRPQNCTKKSDSKCARRINFFERCRCF